ncbi:MAG: glycosyltransferase [Prolixibacteraceae bacterium]|jgi:glycosyltransferase involved in cell wall biosynthesis|nr:glycosyltransferase [Prolixibacteraceae bacterium]
MADIKKRIILLGTTWPFRPGGIATFNERLARALIAEGHEVIIYTFSLQYPNFLFPGKSQYSDQPQPGDLEIRIRVNSVNPFNWISVGREIKKLSPDLLIMRFWIPMMAPALGTIARIVRKNRHTRVISLADNIIPHEKRAGDEQLTSYFVESVDGFVTLSHKVMDDLKKIRPSVPVLYTPHPLYDNFGKAISREEALLNLNLDPGYKYLLFFGFIREYKGLDWLLTAFANPVLRKFKVKLLVAGEYYTKSVRYDQIIKNYHLEDLVVLHTNFIADNMVPSYFGVADLVVQPYKDATQSGVTQIAYHYERPILVTNVGGLGETVPHGKVGYAVEPNPEAISEAIVDFLEHDREEAFVANMRIEKRRFTWEIMVETIDKLDNEIAMRK